MLICQCPTCGTKFPRPEAAAGEVHTCPNCGNFIAVPEPPAIRIETTQLTLALVVAPLLILLGIAALALFF